MPTEEDSYDQLGNVDDPESCLNLIDLGLIYGGTWKVAPSRFE